MKILMLTSVLMMAVQVVLAQDPHSDGRRLLAEGNNQAAGQKFAEAARVNPFDAAALNNQAVALAAQGDVEKALHLLERANRLSPNRADILANLTELKNWMNRNTPQVLLGQKPAVQAVPTNSPATGAVKADLLPEPPPLWKK